MLGKARRAEADQHSQQSAEVHDNVGDDTTVMSTMALHIVPGRSLPVCTTLFPKPRQAGSVAISYSLPGPQDGPHGSQEGLALLPLKVSPELEDPQLGLAKAALRNHLHWQHEEAELVSRCSFIIEREPGLRGGGVPSI